MESLSEEKKQKDNHSIQQKNFLSNKMKYSILNTSSSLLNNYNNFETPFQPEELGIMLETSSEMSEINSFHFNMSITNNSFNPKRDLISNIENYKSTAMPNIDDEYYKNNTYFKNVVVDLLPKISKGNTLDFSKYEYFNFNIKDKKLERYFISKSENGKYNIFIIVTYINLNNFYELVNSSVKALKKIFGMENFFDFFGTIYIICNNMDEENIIKLNEFIEKDSLLKDDKDESKRIDDKLMVIYLLENKTKSKKERLINIFSNPDKDCKENNYFIILDSNNKVIKKKPNPLFSSTIIKFMNKKKNGKNDLKVNDFLSFFNFLKELKLLNYNYSLNFSLFFNISINNSMNDLFFEGIKSLEINGKLRTKEYNLINKLKEKANSKKIKISLEEIQAIDVDIDFTEMKCFKCSKIIPDDRELYYCFTCKTKYCYECVQEQLKKEGKEKFIDPKHNLLFFKTRDKSLFKGLDKAKIGNNLFTQADRSSQFISYHSAICNGCRGEFNNSARYICILCRPGIPRSGGFYDFCDSCIEHMIKNDEKGKSIQESNREIYHSEGSNFSRSHVIDRFHDHGKHIYNMVALELSSRYGGGYREF